MRDVKRVAFLVRRGPDCWEGLRSALGLLTENMWAAVFFIGCPIEIPPGKSEDDFQENLEILAELEGEALTNQAADAGRFPGLALASLEEMAERMKSFDLVVPF